MPRKKKFKKLNYCPHRLKTIIEMTNEVIDDRYEEKLSPKLKKGQSSFGSSILSDRSFSFLDIFPPNQSIEFLESTSENHSQESDFK